MQILYIDIFNRFKLFKFPAFVQISLAMLLFRTGPELQFVHHPVSPGRIAALDFLNFDSDTVLMIQNIGKNLLGYYQNQVFK